MLDKIDKVDKIYEILNSKQKLIDLIDFITDLMTDIFEIAAYTKFDTSGNLQQFFEELTKDYLYPYKIENKLNFCQYFYLFDLSVISGKQHIHQYSQVYSFDAFIFFKENGGLLNRELGEKFRREIFEMKSEQRLEKCYEIFKGSEIDFNSMIKFFE